MRTILLFLMMAATANALTLQEISDQVAAANTNWTGLSAGLKSEFSGKLIVAARNAFDQTQRDWFHNFWLRVTAPQVAAANSALPANVRVSARTGLDGLLYVNADLLTDCQSGETYALLRTSLQSLLIVRKFDNEFPAPAPGP